MSEPKIALVMQGGCFVDAIADRDVSIAVIDYDNRENDIGGMLDVNVDVKRVAMIHYIARLSDLITNNDAEAMKEYLLEDCKRLLKKID